MDTDMNIDIQESESLHEIKDPLELKLEFEKLHTISIGLEIEDDNDIIWEEGELEQPHKNNIIECVLEEDDEQECKIINNSYYSDSDYSESEDEIDQDIGDELEHDLMMFNKLIKSQMDIRNFMYKQTIKNYIKPLLHMSEPRLSLIVIRGIKKIGATLELENSTAGIIADILFSFNEKTQIDNFKHLLAPFLVTVLSQKHLLNMIAIIINKHRILLKYNKVNNIFDALLKNRLINPCSLVDWYQSLENEPIHSIDKIVQESIFEFLDELIAELQI
jgi:hypothetical protein